MAALMHPATEARLAQLGRAVADPIPQEVAEATARTAHDLAARLDSEWDTRAQAALRLDEVLVGLQEAERGDPEALLLAVRSASDVLADVSATLAPEAVRHG